jgi:hypothetical protein
MVKYRKPTRPTALWSVLLRKSKDKKYQLGDPMGALLNIPSQDCTGSASEMDAGRTSAGMGLTPNGTNAVLVSPAQVAMRWDPARCLARRSSSVFFITSNA